MLDEHVLPGEGVILGGDFNTVLEHNIDKVEGILKYSPDAVYLGAARYSEGSLIRRFVIPNTQISYTWRFVNPKMK